MTKPTVGTHVSFKYNDRIVTRTVIEVGAGYVVVSFNGQNAKIPDHKIIKEST